MSFDPSHDLASGDARFALERRARRESVYSPLVILLTALAAVGIVLYSWFLLDPGNRGDLLPWSMVIVAETVLISQALVSMWTILAGAASPRDYAYHAARDALLGPACPGRRCHDPADPPRRRDRARRRLHHRLRRALATVRRTATAARRDDRRAPHLGPRRRPLGRGPRPRRRARRATTCAGCSSNGAKAGNVNHALSIAKGDVLRHLRRRLRARRRTSSSRRCRSSSTPRSRSCRRRRPTATCTSVISRGAGYMQTVFYRFIQPGRNRFNAAFCVGTNVVFRRARHRRHRRDATPTPSPRTCGPRSCCTSAAGAASTSPTCSPSATPPRPSRAYTKQQLRWATGGFEILLTHNPLSPRAPAHARPADPCTSSRPRIYLTGITPLLLLLVPPLEIYFDLRPMNLGRSRLGTWLLFYPGFYLHAGRAGVVHARVVPLGDA